MIAHDQSNFLAVTLVTFLTSIRPESHMRHLGFVQRSIRPPLHPGENRKFGPSIGVEFLHDAADVILDGALGEK
jgi:hypothetical protein